MHREPKNTLDSTTQLTFLIGRFQLSQIARKPIRATAIRWHKILGHIGPNTITQLPKHIIGAELTEFKTNKQAPLKIEYKVCLLAKHTQQISQKREHKFPAT